MVFDRVTELGQDNRGSDPVVGGDADGVTGAVVEPGDDLDALGVALGVSQWVVGEV